MRRFFRSGLIIAAILMASLPALFANRGSASDRSPAAEPSKLIVVSDSAQKRSGITTTSLEPTVHRRSLRASGTVVSLERLSALQASHAQEQAAVESTRAQLGYAREEYERLRSLHADDQNISKKDVEAAQAAWRSDQASFEAAQQVLRIRRAAIAQEWGSVLADWLIEDSPEFARLMRQEDMLVLITLLPGTVLTAPPDTVLVEIPGGESIAGAVVSPAPRTDPKIQGQSFWYKVGKTPGVLPGMNVSAQLPIGEEIEGVILPASAIVWWNGEPWVYTQVRADGFAREPVRGQMAVPGGWFVAQGLTPQQRVVVTGAQLLLSRELQGPAHGED